jgi:hemin uptake protein HemP
MNAERGSREEEGKVETGTDPALPERKISELRTVRARDLLGGDRILRIEHEGQLYTLRITRNERLILTK